MNRFLEYEADEHLRGKSKKQRMCKMKRATALRGINFALGSFAEFSLNIMFP